MLSQEGLKTLKMDNIYHEGMDVLTYEGKVACASGCLRRLVVIFLV